MSYSIEITYDTGDSFEERPNQKEILELTWEDLSVAKDNLQRIKEHYIFYEKLKGTDYKQKDKVAKDMARQRWGVNHDPPGCLILSTDDGKDWQIHAYWIGYFERLRGAEIVTNKQDSSDMKFEI